MSLFRETKHKRNFYMLRFVCSKVSYIFLSFIYVYIKHRKVYVGNKKIKWYILNIKWGTEKIVTNKDVFKIIKIIWIYY
jgi:hypothetical protein